jgi:hypothetical protein
MHPLNWYLNPLGVSINILALIQKYGEGFCLPHIFVAEGTRKTEIENKMREKSNP